jgi:uncharacterized membrane protein YfcA
MDGHVWVALGLSMALFNLLGSYVGTSLALVHGAALVRRVLLCVVAVLVTKTAWQAYSPYLFVPGLQ